MKIDINSLGMNKGQQYETIITTLNEDSSKHSAPIGVIPRSNDEVMCRIFNTSKTLSNILNNKEFIVNITDNPKMFTYATINTIPKEYYTDDKDPILNNCDGYFKCKVFDNKKAIKRSDPIRKNSPSTIIKGKVVEMKINNPCKKAVNRGIHMLIESLVNYTRMDIVNSQKQNYYLGRLKESERVIRKVGSKEERKSIELLKEKFKKVDD